jgi:uncharacterized repeat protein (TIGR03803 family)
MRKPNEQRCSSYLRMLTLSMLFMSTVLCIVGMDYTALAQTFTVEHSFKGFPTDGRSSFAGVIQDPAGNLYGTTYRGGKYGGGTVFKVDPSGRETVLFNFFQGPILDAGLFPNAGLIRDTEGNLYGTTFSGGDNNCDHLRACGGTVFKLTPQGKISVLHRFHDADGAFPMAELIIDAAGKLYGTTSWGGDNCVDDPYVTCGTVFQLDTENTLTVLHRFKFSDGIHPNTALVRDAAGNLYGTTSAGGACNVAFFPCGNGTVFKLDSKNTLTILHAFAGGADGAEPEQGLVRDSEGNLYGTTMRGGDPSCSCGVVFKLAPTGSFKVLHTFTGLKGNGDAASPVGGT